MKLELKLLTISMISNFVTASLKIIGGILFGMSSLVADGFHTFTDFVTDIITIIGAKLSKKRPTKVNPFGFGRVQYLTNLFIGIILFLLGLALIVICSVLKTEIPNINILYILMGAIIIKSLTLLYFEKQIKNLKSQNLVVSIEESKSDLISSLCIIFIVICLYFSHIVPFFKYFDYIGGVILSILVAKAGFDIVKVNALNLLGTVDTNEENIIIIKEIIKKIADIKVETIELIKYGEYYKVHLVLILDPTLTLAKIEQLEHRIEVALRRNKKIKIKIVNIDVDPYKKTNS